MGRAPNGITRMVMGSETMYPCDKQVLEKLLTLIDHNECKLALKTWSDYRHTVDQGCSHCPYKDIKQKTDCCMCLESKLRTLSLYEHGVDDFDLQLLNAARKLDQFNQKATNVA